MPPKGSTGTTRRKPLRADRGVRLFAPTQAKPRFRVVAKGEVERTTAPVPVGQLPDATKVNFAPDQLTGSMLRARQEADELFDQLVRWAKQDGPSVVRGDRTINALCDRRIADMRAEHLEANSIDNVDELMRLYIRPHIGQVDVREWHKAHCRDVMNAARETCGAQRLQKLGSVLRSLVTLAHQKPAWLPWDEDPMNGIEYSLKALRQGEGVNYVPESERPSTLQVEALADSMQARGEALMSAACEAKIPYDLDRGWGRLIVLVMGKCGCRLGEALGLTVGSVCRPRAEVEASIAAERHLDADQRATRRAGIVDLPHGFAIDPGRRVIAVTEAVRWKRSKPLIVPPDAGASGKVPKSKKVRWTIYPMSMVDGLVARCIELLERFGPDQGPHALLFPAHDHRFVAVAVDPRRPARGTRWQDQDWWDASLLRRTMYLPAVAVADHWPDKLPLPMRNLRHHFATWSKRHGYADELITACMGHSSVAYTQQRYYRTGADTIPQGMSASERL